ncbi:MAG: InlB B-repeat-containing protein [Lachnospiraceae bacterium]|nr:InlB B-repeat-containing protein [Lachnospiraceae bacterium]
MKRSMMAGKRILTAVLTAGMLVTMLPTRAVCAAESAIAAEQTMEAVAGQAIEAPVTEQTAEATEPAPVTEQTAEATEPAPATEQTTEGTEPADAIEHTTEAAAEEEESQFNDGHTHCVCVSNTSCGNTHNTSQAWTAWGSTTELPTEAGHYYLTADVSLDNDYTAADGLFLCLNGHTVTMNEHSYICDGTLTITNCAAKDNESGVRPGGFVQGAADYVNDYMIKARNLNLYHVSLTSTDVSDRYYLVGHDATSGDDLPDYYIEDCVFTVGSINRGTSAAIMLQAANNVTVKGTKITGSSEFIETNGLKVTDIRGRLVLSDTDILLNTVISYSGSYFGTFTYALAVTSSEGAEAHLIRNCTIGITDTYSDNSVDICAANLTGTGEYDFTNCTIRASATGTGDCKGLSLGSSSTASLDACTVTATNVTENGNGTVYALYKQGSLSIQNGSAVTATTERSAYAYGIFSISSDAAHTLDVVGSAVTGREFGIYLNTTNQAGAQTVNIKNSEITATLPDPYMESGSYKGVGIYHSPSWNDYDTIYLGGTTDVTGASFSINVGRPSDSSSAVDHFMPKLYARAVDGTALSDEGEAINLYCDYRRNNIKTGDQVILEGMSEVLSDKIKLVYPDTCYLGTDGKAVLKTLYYVELPGTGNFAGCEDYGVYTDPTFQTEVWNKYNNSRVPAGVKLYLKAVPKTHYTFDKWTIRYRENNQNVEYGEGELLDQALTVNENSFTMPTRAIEVRPSFKEAASYTITYAGGSQSDGTVADFTGKKYEEEAATLVTKVFKNRDINKSQTGWAATDGGPKAYDLGGSYETDAAITLYPYWEGNFKITLKYGNLPPEGHTPDETVATYIKVPGQNFYLASAYEDVYDAYEEGGTASSPYYYCKDENTGYYYMMDELSVNADGSTLDYMFGNDPDGLDRNYYKNDADITLYPHWERLYRVNYAPGTYGVERDEPLPDQFKMSGRSVTLAGKVNSNNSKVVAYESKRENYQQGGWSKNADGSTKDFNLGAGYSADADVTLYPYWEPIYTVTYSPGTYGVGIGEDQTVTEKKYHDVSYNIREALFMRSGYIQTGWTTDPDGAGEKKAPRSNYNLNADLNLYPYWERTYAITYVPDEKCAETEPVRDTKYPGVGTKIRSDVFTAEGFTLEGYTTTQGGTDVEYNVEYNYTTDADITLYPVWKAETFALTVGNVQVTSANKADVLGDNTVSYDPETSTLTLKGAAITTYYALDYGSEGKIGSGIYASSSNTIEIDDVYHIVLARADRVLETLTIVLEGENSLIPAFAGDINGGAGIMTDKVPLTIKGTGKLTINSEIEGDGKTDYAISCSSETYTKSAFCLKSGTLDLTAGDTGIFVTDAKQTGILIEGGTLNATVKHDGGYALAAYAMNSMTGIQVNGGTVNLTTLGNKTTETYMGTTYTYTPTLMYVDTYDSDGVVFRGGTVVMENKGTDGYGILINGTYNGGGFGQAAGRPDDDGDSLNEDSFEALGIEDYVGACFIAGDVTIKSKTASIRENADIAGENAPYRSIYLGEGVTVRAGADAAGATAVNNYPTAFASYKYADFTGGTTPAYTLYVGGEAVTASHLSGTGWTYDTVTSTLTLTDADITDVYDNGDGKYSIYSDSDLTIKLVGNSTAGYGEVMPDTAIEVTGDLTFTGTGSLGVTAAEYGAYTWAGDIAIAGGSLFVNAGRAAICSNAAIEISGGRLEAQTAEASNFAISADDGIRISGGDIVIGTSGYGVDAGYRGDMVVSGGTVEITSLYNSVECDNYVQSGGDVSLVVTCDTGSKSYNSYALNMDGNITVTGGRLYTEAKYMCIRNTEKDGTVTVRGGLMQAFPRSKTRYQGSASPTINDFNTFNIYGGRLEITGSSYGIMHKNNTTAVPVNIYGGSLCMDLTEGDRSGYLRVFYGSVSVKMPVSRYSTSLNDSYKIKSGDYSVNCRDFAYDYLSISAIQTISYRPGINGTGEPADIVKDAGVPITLKNAIYTRDGFVQNGWAENDAEDAAKAYDLGEVYSQNADLILYPTWAEKRTITYNHGSAAENTDYTDPVPDGSPVELRGLTYTRAGYVQTGWATTATAAAPEYALGESITVNADKVLYPVFSKKIHVTYDKGSRGRGENRTDEVSVGAETTIRGSIFVRTGFAQTGWSLTDGGEKAYDLSAKVRFVGDTTLYPVWGREYTVTYKPANDATETAEYTDSAFEGTEMTIRDATYTRERAEQTGWNTKDDGKGTGYAFSQNVVMNSSLVLYPVFTDIITITYDRGADGTGENVSEETLAGTKITLKEAIFTREGYNQTGWTMTDGGNKQYALSAETSFAKDTTLYPFWEKIPDPSEEPENPDEPVSPGPAVGTVLFALNVPDCVSAKNSAGKEVRTAKENEIITLTWKGRTGYAFVKWNLKGAAAKDAAAATTTFLMPAKDVTVDYEEKPAVEYWEALPDDADITTKVASLKFANYKSLVLEKDAEPFANPAESKPAPGKELPQLYYLSANTDIVIVDKNGTFYPMGLGETTVTARCGKKTATCKVSVVCFTESLRILNADLEDVTGGAIEMKGGEQAFLTASFDPYDSTDPRAVTWSSNSKDVTVKSGLVTAKLVKNSVNARITAKYKATDPTSKKLVSKTAEFTVNVSPVDVPKASAADKTHSLKLSKKTMKLNTEGTNEHFDLSITVTPAKKSKLTVAEGAYEIAECFSTNENVVTVSDTPALEVSGKKGVTGATVSAVAPGTAYIVVKSKSTESGDKMNIALCKVTVTSPATAVSIESGTLEVNESADKKTMNMRLGQKGIVEIELDPEFSTDCGKVKLTGSGGVVVKNGVIFAKKVTKKNRTAKLTVKCGKKKNTVYVTIE